MLLPDVGGNGDALPIVVQPNEHQASAAHDCLFVAVNIELAGLYTDCDALAADAIDLAIDLDEVVLLHGRLEQDLFNLQRHHVGTMADFVHEGDRRFIDPTEHRATKQVVVHSEIVLLADFGSKQLHGTKVVQRVDLTSRRKGMVI